MSAPLLGLIGIILVLVIMFFRVPVAFSMLVVGFLGILILKGSSAAIQILTNEMYQQFSSYTLSVVPLFALMGLLASYSGVGSKLFRMADKFSGHISGGLCIATQLACGIFGAICGSIPATIATMGTVAYPEMKKSGYDDSLSTASIASGACLSILIPPSVTFIIYGIMTEQSIGSLFISGIIPGILLMLLFMLVGYFLVKRNPALAPKKPKASWGERIKSVTNGAVLQVLLIFLLSIGGIFFGWFTATEAGAVGAGGMLLVCILSKQITWKQFVKALMDVGKLTAMVFILVAGASVFSRFFALSKIPAFLGVFLGSLTLPHWVVMAFIIVIYLILGMLIDELAMILLTVPIFFPIVVTTMGYDPLWFGVIIVMCMSIGALTPPIGMNVFVLKGAVGTVPLFTIFRGCWPYVFAMCVAVILIIAFPALASWLPSIALG